MQRQCLRIGHPMQRETENSVPGTCLSDEEDKKRKSDRTYNLRGFCTSKTKLDL